MGLSSVTPGCGTQESRALQLAQMNLNPTTAVNVQLCKIYSPYDKEKTSPLCKKDICTRHANPVA